MADNISQYKDAKCKEPFNPLDPAVYFDPTFDPPVIADISPDIRNTNNEILNADKGSDTDPTQVEGVEVPKVQVGGQVILSIMLKKFVLDYQYLMPTLYLEVWAHKGEITSDTYLSVNNVVRISFRPSADGKYKKISWNFHIYKHEKVNGLMKIWCTLKYLPILSLPDMCGPLKLSEFTKMQLSDIPMGKYFNHSNTDVEVYTEEEPDPNDPTSDRKYNCCQILAEMANKLGLGFAATDHCISDKCKSITHLSGQPYYLMMQDAIRQLGSTNYIYDAWVDPYGYLVLVNMAYLFKTEVEADHLVIMGLTGMNMQTSYGPHSKFVPVRRVITNFKQTNSPSDLQFIKYDVIDNFTSVHKNGTDKQYMVVTPEDGSLVPDADTGEDKAEETPEETAVTNPEATTPKTNEEPPAGTITEEKLLTFVNLRALIYGTYLNANNEQDKLTRNSAFQRFNEHESELNYKYESAHEFFSQMDSTLDHLIDYNTTDADVALHMPYINDPIISPELEQEIQDDIDKWEEGINLCIMKIIYNPEKSTVNSWKYGTNSVGQAGIWVNKTKKEKILSSTQEETTNTTATIDNEEEDLNKANKNDNYNSVDVLAGTGDETGEDSIEFTPNNSISSIDMTTNPIPGDAGIGANEFRSGASKQQIININNSASKIIQEEISKNYIQNKRTSKLRVVMDGVNMGLERGTWVQVAVFEYGTGPKEKIMHEETMTPIPGTDKINFATKDVDTGGRKKEGIIADDEVGLPNDKLTDLYYIDGMTFEYTSESKKLHQILYLIKRSSMPITQ